MTDQFTKDEYEMQLYDFTLCDFKEENFMFINEQIKKSMQFMSERFTGMVNKNVNEETKSKIANASKIITKEIEESCKRSINTILNTQIDELLSIPSNVLLPNDKIHNTESEQMNGNTSSRQELVKECSELHRVMNENAYFLSCLEEEYNSYAIKDVLDQETELINAFEDHLNASCDVNVYMECLQKTNIE